MARIFPSRPRKGTPSGERRLFEALSKLLPDDYHVFHSVSWITTGDGKNARDGELDFLIVHPQRGMLCMEVKGGGIALDAQSGIWTSTDRNGECREINDPFRQVTAAKHALISKLKTVPSLAGRWIHAGHSVAFPDCGYHKNLIGPDRPREIILFAEDLTKLRQWVESAFDYFGEKVPIPLTIIGELEKFLAPVVRLPSLHSVLKSEDERILKLTNEQTKVLDGLRRNRRVRISGGAGTGKSLLARAKAMQLANEGMRTLLTCYNKPLADFLKDSVKGNNLISVFSFQGLCTRFAKMSGVPLPSEPVTQDYFDKTLPEALFTALTKMPDERFDAIIVDEGQDFAEDWLLTLDEALKKPGEGIFYAFHDDNQRIYQRTNQFLEQLPVVYTLTRNLRNSRQIYKLAQSRYSGGLFEGGGPVGKPVQYVRSNVDKQEKEIAKALDEFLRKENTPFDYVAVLLGRRTTDSKIGRNGSIGSFACATMPEVKRNKVLLESVHRFKGLEKPIIILADLENEASNEELIYVAVTRARLRLVIIGSESTLTAIRKTKRALHN